MGGEVDMMTGDLLNELYDVLVQKSRDPDHPVVSCASFGAHQGDPPKLEATIKDGFGQRHTLVLSATEINHERVYPADPSNPPYKEGDAITINDHEFGLTYRATVECVTVGGVEAAWTIGFESVLPIESNDSRHYVGTLEANDDGTSEWIVSTEGTGA